MRPFVVGGLAKAAARAVTAQAIGAAGTFGLNLALIAVQTKQEYGTFAVGFGFIFLLGGALTAYLGPPLTREWGNASRARFGTYLILACVLGLASTPLVVMASALVFGHAGLALAVCLSAVSFSLRDLSFRAAYAVGSERVLVFANTLGALSLVFACAIFWLYSQSVSPEVALAAYGASQLVSAYIVVLSLRSHLGALGVRCIGPVLRQIHGAGAWMIAASLAYNVRATMHSFLAIPLGGAVAIAEVNAVKLLIQPAILIIAPMSNLAAARLVRAVDARGARKSVIAIFVGMSAFYAAALIAIAFADILPLPAAYASAHLIAPIWALTLIAIGARVACTTAAEAVGASRLILFANLLGLIVAAIAGIALANFGLVGIVVAIFVGEAVNAIALLYWVG